MITQELTANHFEISCPFYHRCILPKNDLICKEIESFSTCSDYQAKKFQLFNTIY